VSREQLVGVPREGPEKAIRNSTTIDRLKDNGDEKTSETGNDMPRELSSGSRA